MKILRGIEEGPTRKTSLLWGGRIDLVNGWCRTMGSIPKRTDGKKSEVEKKSEALGP